MPKQRMPVVLGRGVDRATGLGAQQPSYPVYAANVYGRDAKTAVRPGMAGTGFPPLAWGTDILALKGVKLTLDVLAVVYDRDSREMRIYRLDTATRLWQTLTSPANGLWGTLSVLADFPVVSVSESGGVVAFAHDEDTIALRLSTVYYTPNLVTPTTPGTLTTLTAILTPDGVVAEPVYFRGVFAHLEYLMGWGFGSVDDPDRGDVVRVSRPTAPTDFRAPNYLTCGSSSQAIIGAGVVGDPEEGGGLLIFGKEDEMYRVPGTNFDTFRPQLHDPDFGFVSSRVTRNVGRRLFTWSNDGPREVTAGGSVSIAQALELISPAPLELPLLGPSRMAFAAFDKLRKRLGWYWPEPVTARVPVPGFLLSLWDPGDPRWAYDLIEQPVLCEGALISTDTGQAPDPPVGYVSAVLADDTGLAADARYRSVLLAWENNQQTGSETVEVFAKPTGGAWASVLRVPVSDAAEQTATWPTALPVTAYALALRYLNGSVPATGYEDSDPDLWTAGTAAGSKGTGTTTSAAVTSLTGSAFVNAATPITLTWVSAQLEAPYLLEKNAGAGWVTVVADLVATTYAYAIPGAEVGGTTQFRVTPKRGAVAGPTSATLGVLMQVTVGAPVLDAPTWQAFYDLVTLVWSAAANATAYLVEKSVDGGGSWTTVGTVGGLTTTYQPTEAQVNIALKFRVTGQNGAISGVASNVQTVTTTMAVTAPAIAGVVKHYNPTPTPDNPCSTIDVLLTGGGGNVVRQIITVTPTPPGATCDSGPLIRGPGSQTVGSRAGPGGQVNALHITVQAQGYFSSVFADGAPMDTTIP